MDFIDYRKKLGIGFDNRELENFFFTRMWNMLDNNIFICNRITVDEYFDFCMAIGYSFNHEIQDFEIWDEIMRIFSENNRSLREFLPYYIFLINCQENNNQKKVIKEWLIDLLKNCLDMSHIPYELVKENDDYFIFPKGAKELDDALVSNVLTWLEDYPLSHKAFVKALKEYSKEDEEKVSDVADLFRKALETFFQEFFKSSKSLENIKSEYGSYMKNKGVPTELRNNFETLLQSYTNFMNGYAKHHDKTSKDVLEYIMYQTGSLIRFTITLNND